ncbi:MAG: topoisomerase C-terminal repeat-containing protein, partial [Alphaproteobacteria bacterium]
IVAAIGRFGPYLKHGSASVSLPVGDDILTIGLNRAVTVLAEGKKNRRVSAPLREIGAHPESDKPVVVKSGRYGPYLQHDGINAPLPKTASPETITMDAAVEQLAARGKPAKGRRKAATKKAATKKSSAKKSSAKRSSAKRSSAKKPAAKKPAASKKAAPHTAVAPGE